MTNREKLRELMQANNLNAPAVGKLLEVKADTVNHWLADTARDMEIPKTKLDLLRLKLKFERVKS